MNPAQPLTWYQTLKATDVAIIFATLLGPVLAVQAQKWIERATEKRRRRQWIFEALMSTRATILAPKHVEALNAIPLAFYGKRGALREIVQAWKVYLDHLNSTEIDPNVWLPRRIELLVALLHRMSRYLGYDFGLVELKKEAYVPRKHGDIEMDEETIRRGLAKVLKGEPSAFPLELRAWPTMDEQAKAAAEGQKELQKELLAWLRGETAPHVQIDLSEQVSIPEAQIQQKK